MNRFEYAEASTRRGTVDPEYQRPIDPATQRAYDDGTGADRVIREAEASRMIELQRKRSEKGYPS